MKKISPNERSQVDAVSPIVLVTCIDDKGKANIITLHMFMRLSPDPHLVCINVLHQRYSHDLIVNSGEFVVNFPSIALEEAMKTCGSKSGRNVDKFKEAKLTPITAKKVKPPLIRECPVNIECTVKTKIPLGVHHLFLGEVIRVHINEDILNEKGKINFIQISPIVYNQGEYWSLHKKIAIHGFSKH